MHVAKGADAKPKVSDADIFTGEVATAGMIDHTQGKRLRMALIQFSPGGRTKWHRHAFEQGLVIVAGRGIVATEDAEHVVEAGDVVVIPEGEKHWHGGTNTTGMSHISITGEGANEVLEAVENIRTPGI